MEIWNMKKPTKQSIRSISCNCDDFKRSQWCHHLPQGTVKTGWDEEEMAKLQKQTLKPNQMTNTKQLREQ